MKWLGKWCLTALLIASLVLLTACGGSSGGDTAGSTSGGSTAGGTDPAAVTVPDGNTMFDAEDRKTDYETSDVTEITLSGSSAAVSGTGATVSGGQILISASGVYRVTGNGTDQSVIVDADGADVRLVLSDLTLTHASYAPVYVRQADHVYLILEGTNTLTVTGGYVQCDDNQVDGVIFAKDDLTLSGTGTLTVSGTAHGIVGKDDLMITGGTLIVRAEKHGIQANDSVRITSASLDVTSGKDGIHVENTEHTEKGFFYMEDGSLTVSAGYDGVDASGTLQIAGGEVTITAGGGSGKTVSATLSQKGLKSGGNLCLSGGSLTVNSADDSVHTNASCAVTGGTLLLSSGDDGIHADASLVVSGGSVTVEKSYEGLEGKNVTVSGGTVRIMASDDGINAAGGNDSSSLGGRPGQNPFSQDADCYIVLSGGDLYINASGDGIDSNGDLTVSGGTIVVEGPTSDGDGALDYDGTGSVTGGTLIAIGSAGMAMNFSTATQGSILLNVGSQRAGTTVTLTDSAGNAIVSLTSAKAFASVVITSPALTVGGTYTLQTGSGSTTLTLTTLLYGSGGGFGEGGNPGGNPGGGPGGNPGGRPGGRW